MGSTIFPALNLGLSVVSRALGEEYGALKITIKRNACFIIETDRIKIVVDPYLPKTDLVREEPDYVVVSHGHLDHAMNLRHTGAPIYGNKHVAKFKETDVCIDSITEWALGDVLVTRIRTYQHPHWSQSNPLYDLVMFPFSGIVRCGRNYGFVFRGEGRRSPLGGKTVYYTSDTRYDADLFEEVQRTHRPDLILYSVQPTWLFPRLLMTRREAQRLAEIFSGALQPVHVSNSITDEILVL